MLFRSREGLDPDGLGSEGLDPEVRIVRFGRRLAAAVGTYGPLCVGIDPHSGLLADWGLPDDASGVERFGRTLVDSLADEVALIKPQSAFFERHGSRGVAALEAVLADACAAGLLVLLDVKRGDIRSEERRVGKECRL